jgi:hypothetical protein
MFCAASTWIRWDAKSPWISAASGLRHQVRPKGRSIVSVKHVFAHGLGGHSGFMGIAGAP